MSSELESLHCPPSEHAWCFNAMWAYGCHYSCNSESGPSTVAFDCGIAAIPPSPTCTEIDVCILKNIILVTYLGFNVVVMEGSWIKTREHGRRFVKKDPLGFWIVQYSSREAPDKNNPYVYPASVSQVFFLGDSHDPAWMVVLRHDPRSKRIEGDCELHIFGATGSARPMLNTQSRILPVSSASSARGEDIAEEIPQEEVNTIIREEERPDDDTHLDDTQYEDEVELQYVE